MAATSPEIVHYTPIISPKSPRRAFSQINFLLTKPIEEISQDDIIQIRQSIKLIINASVSKRLTTTRQSNYDIQKQLLYSLVLYLDANPKLITLGIIDTQLIFNFYSKLYSADNVVDENKATMIRHSRQLLLICQGKNPDNYISQASINRIVKAQRQIDCDGMFSSIEYSQILVENFIYLAPEIQTKFINWLITTIQRRDEPDYYFCLLMLLPAMNIHQIQQVAECSIALLNQPFQLRGAIGQEQINKQIEKICIADIILPFVSKRTQQTLATSITRKITESEYGAWYIFSLNNSLCLLSQEQIRGHAVKIIALLTQSRSLYGWNVCQVFIAPLFNLLSFLNQADSHYLLQQLWQLFEAFPYNSDSFDDTRDSIVNDLSDFVAYYQNQLPVRLINSLTMLWHKQICQLLAPGEISEQTMEVLPERISVFSRIADSEHSSLIAIKILRLLTASNDNNTGKSHKLSHSLEIEDDCILSLSFLFNRCNQALQKECVAYFNTVDFSNYETLCLLHTHESNPPSCFQYLSMAKQQQIIDTYLGEEKEDELVKLFCYRRLLKLVTQHYDVDAVKNKTTKILTAIVNDDQFSALVTKRFFKKNYHQALSQAFGKLNKFERNELASTIMRSQNLELMELLSNLQQYLTKSSKQQLVISLYNKFIEKTSNATLFYPLVNLYRELSDEQQLKLRQAIIKHWLTPNTIQTTLEQEKLVCCVEKLAILLPNHELYQSIVSCIAELNSTSKMNKKEKKGTLNLLLRLTITKRIDLHRLGKEKVFQVFVEENGYESHFDTVSSHDQFSDLRLTKSVTRQGLFKPSSRDEKPDAAQVNTAKR